MTVERGVATGKTAFIGGVDGENRGVGESRKSFLKRGNGSGG